VRDPHVVASYLVETEAVIARSGARGSARDSGEETQP
jgi:hypothetical protein